MENSQVNCEQLVELHCINPEAKTFIKMTDEDDAQFVVVDEFGNITQPKENFTKVHMKLSASALSDEGGELLEWTILKAYLVYPKDSVTTGSSESALMPNKTEVDMGGVLDYQPPSYNECCGDIDINSPPENMLPPYSQTDKNDDGTDLSEFISAETSDDDHSSYGRQDNAMAKAEETDVLKRLYIGQVPSVVDDINPEETLSKILSFPDFDPYAAQPYEVVPKKKIITLRHLSYRKNNNEIDVEIDKCNLDKCGKLIENGNISLGRHFKNILVNHSPNEFLTICQCIECLNYREVIEKKISSQLNESKMLLAFLKVFTDFYGSMLKTSTAYNTFQNIISKNRHVYWLTTGLIYSENSSYVNCFKVLTDNMILVLFSSILMVTNPIQLLQIMTFRVEAIVRAYAEGFFESLDNPDKQGELEAEIMLDYIVHGYEEISRISEQVGSLLFAFEKNFLQKFMVTWQFLCKRLYQQHVYIKLTDEMLTCILTLKEQPITDERAALIRRYILFDAQMEIIEKHWPYIWVEINKFVTSDLERERRANMFTAYNDFKNLVEDTLFMSFDDSSAIFVSDDDNLQKLHCQSDTNIVWKNYMYILAKKWKVNFHKSPNTKICDDRCTKCNEYLGYHMEKCQCITCSIAGTPMPPKNFVKGFCDICVVRTKTEKDVGLYESKILNICANDDNLHKSANGTANVAVAGAAATASATANALNKAIIAKRKLATIRAIDKDISEDNNKNDSGEYHIAWAVFKHLTDRKVFKHNTIDEKYFCAKCELIPCLLARRILNNMLELSISMHLIQCYQPLDISVAELCVIVPNLRLFNRNVVTFNIISKMHESTLKVFWIFVISLFAEHFIDLKSNADDKDQLENLQLIDGDISINLQKIHGNNADKKFSEFLEFIRGHPSTEHPDKDFLMQHLKNDRRTVVETDHNYYKQESLNHRYHHHHKNYPMHQCQSTLQRLPTLPQQQQQQQQQIHPQHQPIQQKQMQTARRVEQKESGAPSGAAQSGTSLSSTSAAAVDTQPKKGAKPKKCCYDHPELAEHCKDAHCGKKRIKKECAHARINETRDRLRKKLSQMANARKSQQTDTTQENAITENIGESTPSTTSTISSTPADSTTSIPSTTAQTSIGLNLPTSNSSISDPPPILTKVKGVNAIPTQLQTKKRDDIKQPTSLKKAASAAYEAFSNISNKNMDDAKHTSASQSQKTLSSMESEGATAAGTSPACTDETESPKEGDTPFDDNIAELMQNVLESFGKLSTNHKKWIDEKLNFIEGTDSGGKKQQPQSTNAKKAAKKAKQKQRKEEEKRIGELLDLRNHYQDIYFKEFIAKHCLKTMKMSKKRDKKKIIELENSIKSMQRSKARVEMIILELIATVKQTNSEFKFTYLPTKEQQIEKLRELEEQQSSGSSIRANKNTNESNDNNLAQVTATDEISMSDATTTTVSNQNVLASNNAAYASMPFATHNLQDTTAPPSYSYPIDLAHAQGHVAYGMVSPGMMPQMCYAPPTHAHPQVMTAIPCATTDPSKRIVTIRRLNLPNVAEPQVTVTAKGTSPDKDKLLYTFVNGHMLPMATTNGSVATACGNNNMTVYDVPQMPIAGFMPIPVMATADGYAPIPLSELNQTNLPTQTPAAPNQKKKNKKDKKAKQTAQVMLEQPDVTLVKSKIVQQHIAATTEARTSTSSSNTTSSTASSVTSTSSVANTRENSVSSQQTNLQAAESKKTKKQRAAETKKQAQLQKQNDAQKQKQEKQKDPGKANIKKDEASRKLTATVAAAALEFSKAPGSTKSQATQVNTLQKSKREKVIDNGQFDNNPYKSLHLHESESEHELSSRASTPFSEPEPYNKNKVITGTVQITGGPSGKSQAKDSKMTKKQDKQQTSSIEKCAEPTVLQQQNALQKATTNKKGKKELTPKPVVETPKKKNNAAAMLSNLQQTQSNKSKVTNSGAKPQPKASLPELPITISNPQKRNKAGNVTVAQQSKQQVGHHQQDIQIVQNRKKSHNGDAIQPSASTATQDRSRMKLAAQPKVAQKERNTQRNSKQTTYDCFPTELHDVQPKRNQRRKNSKRKQQQEQKQQQHKQSAQQHEYYDYGYESTGIPNNMGYFNSKDLAIRSNGNFVESNQDQFKQHSNSQYSADRLAQDLRTMHIGQQQQPLAKSYAETVNEHYYQPNYGKTNVAPNVSIMDQLNRGVQVENLSLPPGITLTKVDPAKSEQLRQKSESIKKLSKPLQQQQSQTAASHVFHQHPNGSTIIAPPIMNTLSSYYGAPSNVPYTTIAAQPSTNQSGIIMVEANPSNAKRSKSQEATAAATGNKSSKSKKRRGKGKPPKLNTSQGIAEGTCSSIIGGGNVNTQQPKMITLRNPMFHNPAASSILQQPPIQSTPPRPVSNMPMTSSSLAMDQPAAIIKNENGMYTIRNPALHQAVTNGLAASGYRQLNNVNYYTPQEAAAEAAKANQESAAKQSKAVHSPEAVASKTTTNISQINKRPAIAVPTAPFSYFSNITEQQNRSDNGTADNLVTPSPNNLNNISISCTNVNRNSGIFSLGAKGIDLSIDTKPKYLSAIGSEVKTAQQNRQKSHESKWSNFGIDLNETPCKLMFGRDATTAQPKTDVNGEFPNVTSLQEKYQQSAYYNGFDVFQTSPVPAAAPINTSLNTKSGGGVGSSLFDSVDCHHLHHSCGDDSPPPTITGYNSYLEGIPNTGVIRYDDAAFLKSLIPGQHLTNEVSIHNVNDSNFSRSTTSPVPHRVDITPIFATPSPTSNSQTSTAAAAFRDNLNDYGNESQLFSHKNVDKYSPYGFEFETNSLTKSTNAGVSDLLAQNNGQKQRTSPYLNDASHAASTVGTNLEQFVQNMNALNIATLPTNEEQASASVNGNSGSSNNAHKNNNTTNGWW